MISTLAPVLAGLSVFVYLGNRWSYDDCRSLVVRTSLLCGGYLVVLTETLSLFKAVTRAGLLIGWLLPVAAFVIWAWRERMRGNRLRFPRISLPKRWSDRVWLLGVLAVLAITGLVAWLAPPQTWDSLTYHMSRVAHWAQDRSVWHFATGIDRQDSMSPGAEMITLNTYVLFGGDRLATFTQWLSMLGTLVAVAEAAKILGGNSRAQWLAVYFAMTLPIGIVESSSTINDYVAAFWVVCAAVETLRYQKIKETRALFFAGLAAALAVLAKPIAVPYLLPFGLWLCVLAVRREGLLGSLRWAGAAILIVGLINTGFVARNIITYGGLSNPVDFANHSNQLRTPAGVASTLIKNLGLQAGLPTSYGVNGFLSKVVTKSHLMLGLDVMDPRTTGDGEFQIRPPGTSEDLTSNPYHFYLVVITFGMALLLWRRLGWLILGYSVVAGLTLVLFSLIFKWHVFSLRYHLPYFLLLAPSVGLVWGSIQRVNLAAPIAALLILGARPWLLSIDSRPLIPVQGRSTVDSILDEPRERLYFANAGGLDDPFQALVKAIQARQCSVVGLMLSGDDPEYLLWALMDEPRPDLEFEWIVRGRTDRYSVPDFQPCAIVCNSCDQKTIRGLDLTQSQGRLRLYLEP